MWSGISAIHTSVSQARDSENFLNVLKSRKAVTKILPLFTFFVNSWSSTILFIHRTYGSNRLYKIKPIFIFPIENHIWHFIMQCYLKTQLAESLLILYKVFLCCITHIKSFGTRCKPSTKLFYDCLLQFIMLSCWERHLQALFLGPTIQTIC